MDKSFDQKNAINAWSPRLESLQGKVGNKMKGKTWVPPHEEAKAGSTWRKSDDLQLVPPRAMVELEGSDGE